MKRSTVNQAVKTAHELYIKHGHTLPANAKWDVTDFGLGKFQESGLVLVNLAEEPEYCEKLMFAHKNQVTPAHTHAKKKEDIISRYGTLVVQVWQGRPDTGDSTSLVEAKINGEPKQFGFGTEIVLNAGDRVTLIPGVYHAFWPTSDYCIIGEVSTANDDANDNFFIDPEIGRYAEIEEDEAPIVKLVSDK